MQTDHTIYNSSPLRKRTNRTIKRTFDILLASIVLVLVYPLAYLIIGILIKIKMPGPVIFVQDRTGINGKAFRCYKFRTMLVHDKKQSGELIDDESRVTPLGHFLRLTSLDELPQFWNVLIGDMSIVGPRPHMLLHTSFYQPIIAGYHHRLVVRPGITGWAQVNGLRGETKDVSKMKKRVEFDIWYIKNWSFILDLKIALRTFGVMLSKV